ncbi:MAG TPA: SUMF1/EgtB/PvdO family nonheme iron enzyme [Xanthobacteraceae bacterium]|nr:SUMF1/EgtB/PvdO family nonheme iron enzyme [Xanthobacteraceae bacterium]
MSRIFLSHSSTDNAQAVAMRDWLASNGWKDEVFLDFDPERGIAAGERWERALNEAANRCEAVLFLVSKAWLDSGWCRREFELAHHLNKRLFGVLIEDLSPGQLPEELTGTWQVVRLAAGRDHVVLRVVFPVTHEEAHVTFSAEGLQRLKHGLEAAGLDARYFAWPPQHDPNRAPYRGLRPLEAEDAGVFFGRDAPTVEALDRLRGLRETTPPRLLVILGASGAGKSSFLRAGLFPRLKRDDRNFLPLPVIRPERAAINGDAGLVAALEEAFRSAGIAATRANLRAAVQGGAAMLRPLLQSLTDKATLHATDGGSAPALPTLILAVDQGEELFTAEGQDEAQAFLVLLRDLVVQDAPALIVVVAIRSDSYASLQDAKLLEGIRKVPFDLGSMPQGSYAEVIKGPARRFEGTQRPLKIDDGLIDALLADIERGGAKDALPLLAFTLERLYVEHGGDGDLTLDEYRSLGGITGSIEAGVERALKAADADSAVPKDRTVRLALLRRGLVPWLAGIDPDTGAPRRRVAQVSEIPSEAWPLIRHLVEQRLLATDVNRDTGEATIEPAHEALLRQWGLLQGWLAEDAGLLGVLEGVKRASRDWAANNRGRAWLTHATDRLAAAGRLAERPDLAAHLEPADLAYLAACRKAEEEAKRGRRLLQAAIYVLLVGVIVGLIGWINQSYLKDQMNWYATMRPYAAANFRPYVLTAAAERSLKPPASFRECAASCPEMIVIPSGNFVMGSPLTEQSRYESVSRGAGANDVQNSEASGLSNEGPQHKVVIAKPFAVSKFDVTFADWDACVSVGGCSQRSDSGMGRDTKPLINVSWDDAQLYVAWLSKMTGRSYRLLTEAEWEYAARAGTTTAYYWGDEIGKGNANCIGCGEENKQTSPVGSFPANPFGLYDMAGNVWQWVQDCYGPNYDRVPTDGSASTGQDCSYRVARGGSWNLGPSYVRSAIRFRYPASYRALNRGFRVARTLSQ